MMLFPPAHTLCQELVPVRREFGNRGLLVQGSHKAAQKVQDRSLLPNVQLAPDLLHRPARKRGDDQIRPAFQLAIRHDLGRLQSLQMLQHGPFRGIVVTPECAEELEYARACTKDDVCAGRLPLEFRSIQPVAFADHAHRRQPRRGVRIDRSVLFFVGYRRQHHWGPSLLKLGGGAPPNPQISGQGSTRPSPGSGNRPSSIICPRR